MALTAAQERAAGDIRDELPKGAPLDMPFSGWAGSAGLAGFPDFFARPLPGPLEGNERAPSASARFTPELEEILRGYECSADPVADRTYDAIEPHHSLCY